MEATPPNSNPLPTAEPNQPAAAKSGSGSLLPLKVIVGMSLQLGFSVATATVLCVYGGHWLDEKYTTKYFFWIGLGLGLIISFLLVWKIIQPLRKIAQAEQTPPQNNAPN